MSATPNKPDVLVTGSSGHLGAALMLSLEKFGLVPIGIDRIASDTTNLVGSITSPAFVSRVFADNPTITHVIHTATLHKPHVGSHTKDDFIQTNISGTLLLLEEGVRHGKLESFVFLSTTSAFGSSLSPKKGQPAAWIEETVVPVPKNIYGATKTAAEDICYLVHKEAKLPIIVLRTSRFFPEKDDDQDRRESMDDDNLKVCELTYRRVDIEDVVRACVCATKKARDIGWGKYIISAPPPFNRNQETLMMLDSNAAEAMKQVLPGYLDVFGKKGWKFLDRLDRVYDSSKAVKELAWEPEYTFERVLDKIANGEDWVSELTHRVGKRGYHAVSTGVYTVR
jgi:nucleoside-diphosphate-sugar epimerase